MTTGNEEKDNRFNLGEDLEHEGKNRAKKSTESNKEKNQKTRKILTWKNFLIFSVSIFTICAIAITVAVINIIPHLQHTKSTENFDFPSIFKIYGHQDSLISEHSIERRNYTNIEQIPDVVKNAFIAAEDKNFYNNCGIDFLGLLNAMKNNVFIVASGKKTRLKGASTITQQLVKNVFLSRERTVSRKFKEFVISYKITQELPKDKILEMYLNYIYFGHHSYGIDVAAKTYFGKNLTELELHEIAALAAMPKAPSALSPISAPNSNAQRRKWVLKRMHQEGYITKEQFDNYANKPLVLQKEKHQNFAWAFSDYIMAQLQSEGIDKNDFFKDDFSVKTTLRPVYQEIAQSALDKAMKLYTGRKGYSGIHGHIDMEDSEWKEQFEALASNLLIDHEPAVVLSVSPTLVEFVNLQDQVFSVELEKFKYYLPALKKIVATKEDMTEVLYDNLEALFSAGDVIEYWIDPDDKVVKITQTPKLNGAVVIASSKTGEIYAMVGGYKDLPSTFNRAVQAQRQLGSTIKPFVYGCALEAGVNMHDIFIDDEVKFVFDSKVWTPHNHTHRNTGAMTVRNGLERSLNVITIKVIQDVGFSKIRPCLRRFDLLNGDRSDLSLVLGTGESTVLNLAQAFTVFANKGKPKKLHAIKAICKNKVCTSTPDSLDSIEDIIDEQEGPGDEVYEESTEVVKRENNKNYLSEFNSYQIASALRNFTQTPIMLKRSNYAPLKISGKTGTSQEGKDLWFSALVGDLVVTIYAGFDNFIATGNEYGASVSYPAFVDIAEQLLSKGLLEKVPDLQAGNSSAENVEYYKKTLNAQEALELSSYNSVDEKYAIMQDAGMENDVEFALWLNYVSLLPPKGLKWRKVNKVTGEVTGDVLDFRSVIFEAYANDAPDPLVEITDEDNSEDVVDIYDI